MFASMTDMLNRYRAPEQGSGFVGKMTSKVDMYVFSVLVTVDRGSNRSHKTAEQVFDGSDII